MVGEPWKLLDIIGAVLCLTGVALIAHPTAKLWVGWILSRNVAITVGILVLDEIVVPSIPSLLIRLIVTPSRRRIPQKSDLIEFVDLLLRHCTLVALVKVLATLSLIPHPDGKLPVGWIRFRNVTITIGILVLDELIVHVVPNLLVPHLSCCLQ